MVVLPADHVIKDTAAFQKTVLAAAFAAQETGALVTIGIKPTWASPGFGYIEQGPPVQFRTSTDLGVAIHRADRFREKPNAELAESFIPRRQLPVERRHVRLGRAVRAKRIQPAHT
jgi:mannose-1-phosphate guanylyltransferase